MKSIITTAWSLPVFDHNIRLLECRLYRYIGNLYYLHVACVTSSLPTAYYSIMSFFLIFFLSVFPFFLPLYFKFYPPFFSANHKNFLGPMVPWSAILCSPDVHADEGTSVSHICSEVRTFTTYLLIHMHQKKKIALKLAEKINASVNELKVRLHLQSVLLRFL
jgi:hypothetical protein